MSVRGVSQPPQARDEDEFSLEGRGLLSLGAYAFSPPRSFALLTTKNHDLASSKTSRTMSTSVQDFRDKLRRASAMHRATDAMVKWLDGLLDCVTDTVENASRERNRNTAREHLASAKNLIEGVQEVLEQHGTANEQIASEQNAWMGACASYLRKAKRYWRGESDSNSGESKPSRRLQLQLTHQAHLPAA